MIRPLDAAEAEARIGELVDLLIDAVAHGASVNFMAGLERTEAAGFWRAQLAVIAAGRTVLLVAEADERLVGTVLLMFAPQPNAPHRADVGKMLVHSSRRRQGIGRRLLEAVEAEAVGAGRTLLLLDTETGGAGDKLYRACGWHAFGGVPGHAYRPEGVLAETTFFYKTLAR